MGEVSRMCRESWSRLHPGQESRLIGHGKEEERAATERVRDKTRDLIPGV